MSDEAVLTHKVWGTGTGDPILLLNGGMMTFQAWQPVAAGLESEFRLIGFDFRGMLLSPGAPPSTLDGHVADVVALLDHLQIGRVHAVGTSFGALVAILLAACQTERVRSLVAITGAERVSDDVWEAAQALRKAARAAASGGDGGVLFDLLMPGTFSDAYTGARAEIMALRRQQFAAMPRAWFEGLDALLGCLHGLDLRPVLPRLTCPTLVVGAGLDVTFPPAHSRALAEAISGARLEIVPDSGHALVAEQPGRVVELLRSFLPGSS